MQQRRVGETGLKVSAISLGSWLATGEGKDSRLAADTIRTAYSLGVTAFDTANVYGLGEAERLLGDTLRPYTRSSYVLSTKAFWPVGPGANDRGLSRKHLTDQLHASLQRLQTDYVDLFYCHRYDAETPLYETLRTLEDFVRQGKILYIGVSEWTAEQLKAAVKLADKYLWDRIVVNQPLYNLLNRTIEAEVVPMAAKYSISQIVFSPLCGGLLTGKYEHGKTPPTGSRAASARTAAFVERYMTDENWLKIERLRALAKETGVPLAQLSLAWVLAQPHVSSAIIGASRPEQVRDNLRAMDVVMSEELLTLIAEAVRDEEEE